jgi:hypothetical protein
MSRFEQILEELTARPRMFVLDDRFVTLVAFIDGLALGLNDGTLDRFQKWVAIAAGAPDSRHWSAVVASRVSQSVRDGAALSEMSEDEHAQSSSELFEFLRRFLELPS